MIQEKARRIREAIDQCRATQVAIASYCSVSEQAVARWKAHGQISHPNLFKLSEITGFRYQYLKTGELPEKIGSNTENRRDYRKIEMITEATEPDSDHLPSDLAELLSEIRKAYFSGKLDNLATRRLKSFIAALQGR